MKKNILIVNNNMAIGGIQKSLANLLNAVSDKYNITLLLLYKSGDLLGAVPDNVKVIEAGKAVRIMGMTHRQAMSDGIITGAYRSFWTILTRIFGTKLTFPILSKMYRLKGEYDCAISFMQNSAINIFYGGCNEIVLNSVKSPYKVCFIHCDFLNYEGNNSYNIKTTKRFDRIVGVSKSVTERFLEVVPDAREKAVTVRNCYDFDALERMGGEYEADYTDGVVNIFSASRISAEKGILRMIPIFERIKKSGAKFKWRIAGGGIEAEKAKNLTASLGLENDIIFLGQLANPYPYFKRSDLLLVPSYAEAAPMVFGEAKFFGLPVFTTDTTSAVEMVKNEGIGDVCANNDEDIEKELTRVIANFKREKYKKTADNSEAAAEFEKMLIN
ncbi:MAG: glycosyltransferase [Firmicutes bacterium]|nr:glycosyltransferase [Bacillota bacterium]